MPDDQSSTDRAYELLVYAPIGAAMYVRDMLPGLMGIFVARGKREVQTHRPGPPTSADVRRRVNDGLGVARSAASGGAGVARDMAQGVTQGGAGRVRDAAQAGSGAAKDVAYGGVGIARDVAQGGVGIARDVAGTALAGFLQWRSAESSTTPATDAHIRAADTRPAAPAAAPTVPLDVPDVDELAIPDYDELSASQVVERLDGLDATSLELVRRYETAHRGRNTVLGKIAQLS